MKKSLFYIIIITILLISCNNKSIYTSFYNEDEFIKNRGVSYNLPKNLIKVEISYTLRENRKLKKGIDLPTDSISKISIEDPILISTILIPDKEKTFVIKNEEISNYFFNKSDIDIKLSDNGLLTSIDSDIQDKSFDFAEKIVVSTAKLASTIANPSGQIFNIKEEDVASDNKDNSKNEDNENSYVKESQSKTKNKKQLEDVNFKEQEYFNAIEWIQKSIITAKNKEEIDLAKSKLNFYLEQLDWYRKNNKNYQKITKLKYTILIDPMKTYNKDGNWSELIGNKIYHHIYPKHIFPQNSEINDTITIELPYKNFKSLDNLSNVDLIKGVLYRNPSSVNVDITSNGRLLANSSLFLAQFGDITILPLNAKKFGDNKTSVVFSSITGGLNSKKVVAGNSSENLSKSLENSIKVINEKLEYQKNQLEIKELERLNTIKKLKDSLKEPEIEVEEPETEYEKLIREANEKIAILELEKLIKKLEKDIEKIENGEEID